MLKRITDNKKFWKTMKPLFPNKSKTSNTIIAHENNRIIKDNKKYHILRTNTSQFDKKSQIKKEISC